MGTRGHRPTYRTAHGFTLVELLVALAIVVVVMAGLMMLFAGSIRAVRQGYQAMDAFERARGTLTVLENDLATAFASLDYGDTYTFYGTPLGMTFIGLDRSATGSKGLARITYVVYNDPGSIPFLDALELNLGGSVDAYPYPLLRYVEPDVAALDDFYIDWADPRGDGLEPPFDGDSLEPLLNAVLAETQPRYGDDCEDCDRCQDCPDCANCQYDSATLTEEQQQRVWAKKCELWIRMLAGGDGDDMVPSYWKDLRETNEGIVNFGITDLNAEDYAVTENLLSTNSPIQRSANTFGPYTDTDNCIGTSECHHFFDYRYRPEVKVVQNAGTPSFWWNGPCAYNWEDPDIEDWLRLPGAVDVGFWLMFEAATVGAPEFKRWFSLQIDVPAGYSPPEE